MESEIKNLDKLKSKKLPFYCDIFEVEPIF